MLSVLAAANGVLRDAEVKLKITLSSMTVDINMTEDSVENMRLV